MNDSANVKSLAAIQDVKASLAQFSEHAKESMTQVDLEIRRLLEWILSEQPQFWQRQIRERGERVTQAKVDLMRCRMFRVTDDHVPDCMEQKIALRKAERQLEEAEEKLKKTRAWGLQLPQMVDEYLSQAQQLSAYLDGDLYRAAASLERMMQSLELYTSLAPPVTQAAVEGPVESVARPVDASYIAPTKQVLGDEQVTEGAATSLGVKRDRELGDRQELSSPK